MGMLLKSTCNTFLKTLEECMQIANAAFTSELLYHTPPGSPQLAVLKSSKVKPPSSVSLQKHYGMLKVKGHILSGLILLLEQFALFTLSYLPLVPYV